MNILFVIPVLLVIIISVFIVKVAAVALNLTGLDKKRSFFQALSAFTGTGFTTKDSELVVGNDIRRKIIIVLMILGNAGLISVITTLTVSFVKGGLAPVLLNISLILIAILLLIRISINKSIARKLTRKIRERLMKSATFTRRPVEEVLRLAEGYGVAEVTLTDACEEIGKTLIESSFRQKDILVLAIEREDGVIPAPHAHDRLFKGDVIICYGKLKNISSISN